MPPDPERLADTQSWLRKTANDLRCADIDLAVEPPATEDAVFHSQQAVEKAPTAEESREILGRAVSVVDELRNRIIGLEQGSDARA